MAARCPFHCGNPLAANLVRNGELLAAHPDFRRCFQPHYPDTDPRDALLQLCQFFVCAPVGVLQKWIENNRPIDSLNDPMGPRGA